MKKEETKKQYGNKKVIQYKTQYKNEAESKRDIPTELANAMIELEDCDSYAVFGIKVRQEDVDHKSAQVIAQFHGTHTDIIRAMAHGIVVEGIDRELLLAIILEKVELKLG